MGQYSDFLFARGSFIGGMARAFDLGGVMTEFNRSPSPEMADAAALDADWKAVGEDMRRAMADFRRENGLR